MEIKVQTEVDTKGFKDAILELAKTTSRNMILRTGRYIKKRILLVLGISQTPK